MRIQQSTACNQIPPTIAAGSGLQTLGKPSLMTIPLFARFGLDRAPGEPIQADTLEAERRHALTSAPLLAVVPPSRAAPGRGASPTFARSCPTLIE